MVTSRRRHRHIRHKTVYYFVTDNVQIKRRFVQIEFTQICLVVFVEMETQAAVQIGILPT
jgi:hypothetical protein